MNPREDKGEGDEARRLQLGAYLDGELPPEEAREVLRWLETHPAALRRVEEDRRIASLLGLYADEPVAEEFADKVLTSVGAVDCDAAARPTFSLLRGRPAQIAAVRIAAVAAAVLLAVGLGVMLGGRGGGTPAPISSSVAALDTVPAEWLENGDIAKLADLSDDDFEALMAGDPDDLAKQARGDGG